MYFWENKLKGPDVVLYKVVCNIRKIMQFKLILYCKLHPSGSSKNKNNLTYIHYKHTTSYIELFQQVKRWLSDRRGPYINATDCFKKVQGWVRVKEEMNFLKWGIMFEVWEVTLWFLMILFFFVRLIYSLRESDTLLQQLYKCYIIFVDGEYFYNDQFLFVNNDH